MREPELFLLFVRPLNLLGIRYIIGGSVAAIFYGEPRLTHDVDFVVFLNDRDVQHLTSIFHRLKPFSPKPAVNNTAILISSMPPPASKRTCT